MHRGLVEADGSFTDAGRALREEIEERTDRLGLQPYEAIGEDGCAELRSLVRPWSKAIVSGDDFGFREVRTACSRRRDGWPW